MKGVEKMIFQTIILAILMTMVVAFIIENFKLNFDLRRVHYINTKINDIISRILTEKKYFDIFIVNDLRKIFNEQFLNTNIIDQYELYKVDDSKIKLIYTKGHIIEELEILTVNGVIELREVGKDLAG
ncbi:MAG: hypothetical protein PWQ37_573 [Candidatus Petromonas sp.]|jgi:uncharacterized membrane protein YraQ (UPF0718 family)|nr:hypothetical protein [Candidatus Petromonas sp.]